MLGLGLGCLVRLEMDKEHMTMAWFDMLPASAGLFSLAVHLGAGFALGILYFRSLWWSARRFGAGGSLVATIGLMAGRLVLMGGVLTPGEPGRRAAAADHGARRADRAVRGHAQSAGDNPMTSPLSSIALFHLGPIRSPPGW